MLISKFGSRANRRRHLKIKDDNFQKIITFFIKSYRKGILTFCGTIPPVIIHDPKAENALLCFKHFENGEYTKTQLYSTGVKTSQPKILSALIIAKKSWGLWRDQFAEGIADSLFFKKEILDAFEGIEIPESFLIDFENTIYNYRINKLNNFKK